MEKRKVILAAAVAGLVAAGSMMAKVTVVQADEPAAKADGKDSCGGKNGCGAKMEKKANKDKDKCSADKCHTDKCKGTKKVKKKHAAEAKKEEKKAE